MTETERSECLTPPSLDDPILAEIVRRVVDFYHPERVYLFGSTARGEAGPDSDYDLMVIVSDDTPPELRDSDEIYRALWGIRASVDVLVWNREAFNRQLYSNTSLPAAILREGRLLYAA